ncbi:MAG: YggS family pyridoxal phosphate-dependent enzyme [Gemmatimonadota bacterium]|nr:YggS family pyridoxal phosphate-dependent enzyme [Gemmatimonadota bacterium]
MEPMAGRLAEVRERVARAAAGVGRDPDAVELLPVTKGHPVAAIEAVVESGLAAIGENRVPEAAAKQAELGGRAGVRWHLIGRLQRNKARRAIQLFDVIESVDSLKLARALSRIAQEEERESVEILLQVNAAGETQKAGFAPDELPGALEQVLALPALGVAGLMTMAPYTGDERVLRATFRRIRELSERCAAEVPGFEGRVLSMGMSNDFEIAIEEGSTRVRLGTVLLGER